MVIFFSEYGVWIATYGYMVVMGVLRIECRILTPTVLLLFTVIYGRAVGLKDKMEIVHVTKPYLRCVE